MTIIEWGKSYENYIEKIKIETSEGHYIKVFLSNKNNMRSVGVKWF